MLQYDPSHCAQHKRFIMARSDTLLQQQALFGTPTPQQDNDDISLAEQLSERLAEKYRNYERAAARLELRGETDAAKVLRRAAGRLRLIRNTGAVQEECI